MHFRDRGRSIQLVRTSYNPETKKPATEVLGRLRRPDLEASNELKSRLRPGELAELDAYLSRVGRREVIEREYAATRFAETLALVSSWLETVDEATAAIFIDEIQRPLNKLRRQVGKIANQGEDAG